MRFNYTETEMVEASTFLLLVLRRSVALHLGNVDALDAPAVTAAVVRCFDPEVLC